MNYSHITDSMTWSYSRITSYEDCPYKFFLKYIRNISGRRHFFSDYGSFMHLIIQKYLDKELTKQELPDYYLLNFKTNVIGKAPNKNIFHNYFSQGLEYLKNIEEENHEILGVEKEISFNIADKIFIGYIDKVSKAEDGIIITDNKSRALSPRSEKSKPTKQDQELDKYLRQLYLYSIAVEDEFGIPPTRLVFNCFRIQTHISEPFVPENYEKTKDWALGSIKKISEESEWKPNIEWFKCKYLCDVCDNCEYFQMFGGKN
ncbi:MAG: PD-(D/E)XK nuclease family protein [Clostridia bacterium]|nr:PD-(D/E)XK nuclease family protein [Clostridia bacterium]